MLFLAVKKRLISVIRGWYVTHVFDNLKREHHVKTLVCGQYLGRFAKPVVNCDVLRFSVQASSSYIAICLRKAPVRRGSGVLGVRLSLDEAATRDLRHSLQNQR
jgi:hypothetical protein